MPYKITHLPKQKECIDTKPLKATVISMLQFGGILNLPALVKNLGSYIARIVYFYPGQDEETWRANIVWTAQTLDIFRGVESDCPVTIPETRWEALKEAIARELQSINHEHSDWHHGDHWNECLRELKSAFGNSW